MQERGLRGLSVSLAFYLVLYKALAHFFAPIVTTTKFCFFLTLQKFLVHLTLQLLESHLLEVHPVVVYQFFKANKL